MYSTPSWETADDTYGIPLVCLQATWVADTSPFPPDLTANTLFLPDDISLTMDSYSSRVILPSLFRSLLSKNPFRNVLSLSALEIAPSPSASPCLSRSSNVGILNSLSSALPGEYPAYRTTPS